jgi:phage recombination protein Bet
MSKEIVKQDVTADLPAVKITGEDIKKHFCPRATDVELALGLAIVKSLKLNPFLREVHFIKYSDKDKMSIVVGYEVYLKRAERSGRLDGWQAGIDKESKTAWVKIWRKDWKEPFLWEVDLTEFNKKQSTWNQIPSFMGRKVAIAQGFRMAFPDELGGMPYTQEEHETFDINGARSSKPEILTEPKAIAQVETQEVPATTISEPAPELVDELESQASTEPEKLPEDDITLIREDLEKCGKIAFGHKRKPFIEWLGWNYGVEWISELTDPQARDAMEKFHALIREADKKK